VAIIFIRIFGLLFTSEILRVEQEAHDTADRFAVAIVKDETVVGHVPREVLHLVWYFIEHDGTVTCEVTGRRRHGIGLEVPYTYTFSTKKKIKLCKKLLGDK